MIPIPPDVSVLNCGAGDMTFSFDEKNPQECARAERVVNDMLKRGYILFATVDGKWVRVKEFDPERREYVIADGPEVAPLPPDKEPPEPVVSRAKLAKRTRRVSAKGTPVTGIAPTAGG